MEIPNYDSGKSQNENFKQTYLYMPKDTFRLLLCGGSGSGKRNLLCHMLLSPLIYFDQIIYMLKTLSKINIKT